ncbi:hypothetical protein HDZ31DRAFT_44454 [Schizophyllum fasciatum]
MPRSSRWARTSSALSSSRQASPSPTAPTLAGKRSRIVCFKVCSPLRATNPTHSPSPGDLMAFALDNPAPATVIIISADRDFAYAASVLRQRRYNVVMISHSNPRPNLWLTSQAIDCYDWKKDVLHVEERATTIPPILGKSVPSHAEVLAQCLAPIPIANGGKPTPTPPPPAPAPPAVAPQAAIKAANPPCE